jgi:DNA-binding CsgD family transcriptional regulator
MSRQFEADAVAALLTSASVGPSALVVAGEPGIGKTTLWLAAVDQARGRGIRVLSARAAQAESVLAYGSLADLLGEVDEAAFADLPYPQRVALDRALLRMDADGVATDHRAVSAAFATVIAGLGAESPVLLAIDDLQWLDHSSRNVIAFATRRLMGPVGVLGTVRTDADSDNAASWLHLPGPDVINRITLHPLNIGVLREVLSERLGRSFTRPAMIRIHEVSGGNPFYALELGRVLGDDTSSTEMPLPTTLSELVRTRIDTLDTEAGEALLAVACLATPTVDLVARATGTNADDVVALLEDAEGKGIVRISGNRLRFTHPLLARGVYTDATPQRRRAMHRNLAGVVGVPELQARHLALAATSADPLTLQALDEAARTARVRGAPAAAAELLELGIGLGGDSPERRIKLAGHHFDAGDPVRAGALLDETMQRLPPSVLRAEAASLLAVIRLLSDSFLDAAGVLERSLREAATSLALTVQMLITLSFALVNAGKTEAAEQRADEAVAAAERLGYPHLLGQALSMRVMLHFMRGDGLDEPSLQRALVSEDRQANVSTAFSPTVQGALLLAWTGSLAQAHETMLSIRRRCVDHGQEGDLVFVDFHAVLIEIWRGDFAAAAQVTEGAMERALQLGGDLPLFVALTARATVGAYAGQEHEVRRDVNEAVAAGQRSSSQRLSEWPVAALGFLETSLGNYEAALDTLRPLLTVLEARPDSTEIIGAWFVPDAAEVLIQLGLLAEAEPLIAGLERNGRRLDRPWMLAVGARCRSMLLAASGDVDGAHEAAQRAMVEHDRLPMPFERARTQLLLGQLQRRQRHKEVAAATLREALAVFEDLGTPLWADRVRAELDRVNVAPASTALTPTEQRVADLAASGMTNRDVAAALFISPKTVEANLARVYRKLGIHSRAELGRSMSRHER